MKYLIYRSIIVLALSLISCDEDFLDKKPDKALVVPTTLGDLQSLLDNSRVMNNAPAAGIIGGAEIFMSDEGWDALGSPIERNSYVWAKDIYEGQLSCNDWNAPYEAVFYANVVLDGLSKIAVTPANETEWKHIQGGALFYRAFAFYEIAQLFCEPYYAEAFDRPGLPLRLASDVTAPVGRSTVKETYDRIVQDLLEASKLLPPVPVSKTRPALAATHALLARVYLSMEDYVQAEAHATEALSIDGTLLDYNGISAASLRPFTTMHAEVVLYASALSYGSLRSTLTFIDTTLMERYGVDDLRKTIFFRARGNNRYNFKGSYTGNLLQFGGISNNEVYLTRAECRARNGNITGALEDLNALLVKRWRAGTFEPIVEEDPEALLSIILDERRKELVYRANRWTDLRRLNRDPRFQQTLSRKFHGVVYTLPPNDPRYVYEIPLQEVSLSGIEQNVR